MSNHNHNPGIYGLVGSSVESFGAVGNSVTDDTTAINAAISHLPATGGVLYFPSNRTYAISSALNPFPSDTLVVGGGRNTTIMAMASDLEIAAGDTIGLVLTGVPTSAVGVATVTLVPN